MMQGSLAERLRVLRARRGLTLTEAAERAGIQRQTLALLERGERHPHTPTLSKIAEGYDVPVEDLLEEPALAGKAEAPAPSGLEDVLESARDQLQVRNAGEWLAALTSTAEHAEHELARNLYDLHGILTLEGSVVELFSLYRLEARKRIREQGSPQLIQRFEEVEERMRKVRSVVQEASRTRLEQARVEAELDPAQLADIDEQRRARDERLRRSEELQEAQ